MFVFIIYIYFFLIQIEWKKLGLGISFDNLDKSFIHDDNHMDME